MLLKLFVTSSSSEFAGSRRTSSLGSCPSSDLAVLPELVLGRKSRKRYFAPVEGGK